MMSETILISIASYRESELYFTAKSFWEKASNKDRIKFAIVSQDTPTGHPHLGFIPQTQLRYLKVSHKETYGVCWARAITQHMFSDYDYYFQIDGHMFPKEQDWDIHLIEKLKLAKSIYGEKTILSAYPPRYSIVNGVRIPETTEENSNILLNGAIYKKTWAQGSVPDDLSETHSIAGAYLFTDKTFIEEVPIDPEVDFYTEEIAWSIRASARGYKLIYPKTPTFYHCFGPEREQAGIATNPWIDQAVYLEVLNDNTRADKLINGEISGLYGVTRQEVEEFCKRTGYFLENPGYDTGIPTAHK